MRLYSTERTPKVITLLSPAAAGESQTAYYTPLTPLTKDNIGPRTCWNLEQLK